MTQCPKLFTVIRYKLRSATEGRAICEEYDDSFQVAGAFRAAEWREEPGAAERREEPGAAERREEPGAAGRREEPGTAGRREAPGAARSPGAARGTPLREAPEGLGVARDTRGDGRHPG